MNTSASLPPDPRRPSGPETPETRSRWRPRRPVQAVPVSYTASWLHFLMVLCLVVAWWYPLKLLIGYWAYPRAESNQPRDAYAFVALAYEGVSEKENEVRPGQFKEQIDALRKLGYVPITLRDVEGLVHEGRPVPRRSVLLTFDHARKTSYYAVHSYLRRIGWNAVMFLWTRPMGEREPATLLWPYVHNMVRTRIWEVGAQSYDGFRPVRASSKGRLGNFMTSPQWLEQEARYESLEEFRERLANDHRQCLDAIQKKLGLRPLAYAYPFGDFGQYQSRAVVTRPVNLGLVESNYRLGFICGNLALNTRYSDPRRLNRLLVDPSWTSSQLAAYLERSWPSENPSVRQGEGLAPSAWIVDWGNMRQLEKGPLVLFAPEETTGAKMWLAGSDLSRDFYARLTFKIDRGQLGLNLRASPDGESYVYLGIDRGGEVWLRQMSQGREAPSIDDADEEDIANVSLRQKHASAERFTLASSKVPMAPEAFHTLEVYMRDRLLFAHLDGREIFRNRNLLRGEMKPGMFGLSVWSPEKGVAQVEIADIELHRQNQAVATWPSAEATEPYVFKWLYENAYRITQISPVWMTASAAGPMIETKLDFDVYHLISRINHVACYPQVVVDDERLFDRLAPGQLADRVAETKSRGVFLNLRSMKEPTMSRLALWAQQCGKALQSRGLELLFQLPASLEDRGGIHALLAVVPQARVVVGPNPEIEADPSLKEKTVQAAPVPPPEADEELPVFYMIGAGTSASAQETTEAKIDRLQQDGLAAFVEGQFRRAIELWQEWLALEPSNPKALMLLGDAHLRLGETDPALARYDQSLELDPGQIGLALRRVKILDQAEREAEALASLNLYARLFPDQAEVLLAQAQWLFDHRRGGEAMDVAQRVLKLEPDNIGALALLAVLETDPARRTDLFRRLAVAGQKPERQLDLGRAVWSRDLLSIQGSDALLEPCRVLAASAEDPRVREIFARLAPRNELTLEDFAQGKLSDRWRVEGGSCEGAGGGLRMQAGEPYAEMSLRLLGSQHFQQAFIEAQLGEVRGGCWLYANRSAEHFVRFGFTDGSQLYLQVWRAGRLVSERKMSWQRPDKPFALRLESTASGLMGFVDGKAAFSTRLFLPEDIRRGWMGFAVHQTPRGTASAVLLQLKAGPSPLRIAVLSPQSGTEAVDKQLQTLRVNEHGMAALCPVWFFVRPGQEWAENVVGDRQIFRVYARYHRLWLLPVVQVPRGTSVAADMLLQQAARHQTDGFLLLFDKMPDDAWFDAMNEALRGAPCHVLACEVDAASKMARVRGVGRGLDLFNGAPESRELSVMQQAELPVSGALPADLPVMIGY